MGQRGLQVPEARQRRRSGLDLHSVGRALALRHVLRPCSRGALQPTRSSAQSGREIESNRVPRPISHALLAWMRLAWPAAALAQAPAKEDAAVGELRTKAAAGDAPAMFELAERLRTGRGAPIRWEE